MSGASTEVRDGAAGTAQAIGMLAMAVLLFGTAWPAMKAGLADATPVWYAAARAALSAVASFLMVAALGKAAWPSRRDLPVIAAVGTGQLAGFFTLANLALAYVPAGRAAVLAYTTSFWLIPIGTIFLGERLDRWRAAGMLAGISGVAVLFNPAALDWSDHNVVIGHVLLLGAALCWALAILKARTHRWHLSPMQVVPWQMAWAAGLLTLIALVMEPAGHVGLSSTSLLPLLYIAVVVGPAATWAANAVSRALPTIVTSLGFLAVPAVGILSSALALGEPVTPALALGAGLVIGGAALVSLSTLLSGAKR